MTKQKTFFTLLLLAFAVPLFQSCDKEDDASEPNPSNSGQKTLNFSEISNREFRMWTNGQEINTTGFNIADYIPAKRAYELSSGYYNSNPELIFKNDSLFFKEDGDFQGYPYTISNDSIYMHIIWPIEDEDPIEFTSFFGIGNTQQLYIPQSFFRYAEYTENEGHSILSVEDTGYMTPDIISEQYELFDNVNDIMQGDTLILINQRISYK